MNIFKILGFKHKEPEIKNAAASGNKEKPAEQKPDPHANGGCCGSCGGQQGKNL